MKYKYFLFDWDGSLGNTLPLWFENFKKVFAENGIEASDIDIGREVIGDWEGPAKLGVKDTEAFFKRMEELMLEDLAQAGLNEGAKKMIEEIKIQGGKVAVVTTSRKRWVKGALRNNGLRDLVDVFLGKEDVTKFKPDPEILLSALKKMGGKVEEAIMIGDTYNDVFAAKNAGMDSALYYPESYEKYYESIFQKSLSPTYLVRSFEELSEVVVK